MSDLLDAPKENLDSSGLLKDFSFRILSEIIQPNAIWKAGKKMASLRSIAMECIYKLFHGENCFGQYAGYIPLHSLNSSTVEMNQEDSTFLRKHLLPILINLLDEDSVRARSITLDTIVKLFTTRSFNSG